MAYREFSFCEVLKLLLAETGEKPSGLAMGLQRERTLVYKWLSGAHQPKPSYMPQIVNYFYTAATESQKAILSERLIECVRHSTLPVCVKQILFSKKDCFKAFLLELLTLSINTTWKNTEAVGSSDPVLQYASRLVNLNARAGLSVLAWSILSAVAGGSIWNLINLLFGWTYYMGALKVEPTAAWPFIWGSVTAFPIMLIFLLVYKTKKLTKTVLPVLLYTVVAGLGAMFFYTSCIRAEIESIGLAYEVQEILIVVIYSLIVSVPPYLAASIYFRLPLHGINIAFLFIPSAAAILAIAVTLVVRLPVQEIIQLRGFAVGLAIRVSSFCILFLSLCRKSMNQTKDVPSYPLSVIIPYHKNGL